MCLGKMIKWMNYVKEKNEHVQRVDEYKVYCKMKSKD